MSVNFESLISTTSSEDNFLQIFADAFSGQNKQFLEAHRTILRACYRNPQLSPTTKKAKTPAELAKVWLEKYENGYKNRISQRIGLEAPYFSAGRKAFSGFSRLSIFFAQAVIVVI